MMDEKPMPILVIGNLLVSKKKHRRACIDREAWLISLAIDRHGLALETTAPGVKRYKFMPRGKHGLGGFVG
jgi:hypothetical protein